MFFVRGLTSNHKEILVNPEQVLYIREISREKSELVLAHHPGRLVVDQDPPKIQELFNEFYRGLVDDGKLN
jgi:hypothetical protein